MTKFCQSYRIMQSYVKIVKFCDYAIFFRVMTNYGKVFKIFQSYAKVI
jgi:hypothetical protein